jgi:uncharacterized protein (TIGR03435 family)
MCTFAVVMSALLNMLFAQQKEPDKVPSFSVASIKANGTVSAGATLSMQPGGGLSYENVTVKGLVAFAYNVREFQIAGGPGWIDTERYDVIAKSESGGNLDQLRAKVKTLLAERFGLVTRNESREGSLYTLRVARNGSKLIPNKGEGLQARGHAGELFATKVSLNMLASLLAARLDRPVLDQTGITGEYDIKMEWDPAIEVTAQPGNGADGLRPSIFTAIQEQLGLRLNPGKGPIPVVVVADVTKPTPN